MAALSKRIYKSWRVSVPHLADLSKSFATPADAAVFAAELKMAGHDNAQIKPFQSLGWQARIRSKRAPPLTKTFKTKAMAEEWARAREGEIAKRQFFDYREADKFSLGDLLRKYDIEKLTTFDKHDANRSRIRKLCRHPITHIRMSAIQPADFAEFRDQRLRGGFTESRQAGLEPVIWAAIKGTSVKRELDLMSSVISHARREWRVHIALNPASAANTSRPGKAEGDERVRRLHDVLPQDDLKNAKEIAFRSRRTKPEVAFELDPELTALLQMQHGEQQALLRASRYPEWFRPKKKIVTRQTVLARFRKIQKPFVKSRLRKGGNVWAVFSFAIETAMRRGEMLKLEWSHVHFDHGNGYLELPGTITKNRKPRIVPLSLRAYRILKTRPKVSQFVFALTKDTIKMAFQRAKKRVSIVDLRLHDLRHEATSRFFEQTTLRTEEIGHITGHTDPRMLQRYYNLRPEEFVERFAKSRR